MTLIFPRLLVLCAATVAVIALATPAHAQQSCPGADPAARRVALVIGIEDYTHVRKLNNPVRDATAIADLLCRHGIQPTLLKNPTRSDLFEAIDTFKFDASGAELALVYYAGHGMHLGGEDVLLPKDLSPKCDPASDAEARRGTIGIEVLVGAMRGAKTRIALLDACRTTAFPSCPTRGDITPVFRGLQRAAQQGALIATSTSRGSVAQDGVAGRNSPYATLILQHFASRPRSYFHEVLFDVNRDLSASQNQHAEVILPNGGAPPRACLAAEGCGTGSMDDQQRRVLDEQKRDADRKLRDAEKRLREAQTAANAALDDQKREADRKLRDAEQRLREAERRAAEADARATDNKSRPPPPIVPTPQCAATTGPSYRVSGVASDDVLNMRAEPNPRAAHVYSIPSGGTSVYKRGCTQAFNATWCEVAYECRIGWVNARFLTQEGGNQIVSPSSGTGTFRVVGVDAGDKLWIRPGPADFNSKLGGLDPGTSGIQKLTCRSVGTQQWCQIRFGEIVGWVNARHLD